MYPKTKFFFFKNEFAVKDTQNHSTAQIVLIDGAEFYRITVVYNDYAPMKSEREEPTEVH